MASELSADIFNVANLIKKGEGGTKNFGNTGLYAQQRMGQGQLQIQLWVECNR